MELYLEVPQRWRRRKMRRIGQLIKGKGGVGDNSAQAVTAL